MVVYRKYCIGVYTLDERARSCLVRDPSAPSCSVILSQFISFHVIVVVSVVLRATCRHRCMLYAVQYSGNTLLYYSIMYGQHFQKSMDQPGMVANPARGQLNRNKFSFF